MNPTLPVCSYPIMSKAQITHISVPTRFDQTNTLLGLSMTNFGGIALFDIRNGKKAMHLQELNAAKSEFKEHYIGVLT